MKLTRFQRKTLESWRRMHPIGLTWTMGLRRLAPTWGLLFAVAAVVYLIDFELAVLSAAVAVGAGLRDLGYIRSARAVWPVSREVIDWQKVDQLLSSQQNDVA